jgi:hypothetical protein
VPVASLVSTLTVSLPAGREAIRAASREFGARPNALPGQRTTLGEQPLGSGPRDMLGGEGG